jgi:Kef-type K+ transport system membrane component KefB
LRELGQQQTREGHIILGAAVGDDVLGLITLAVVSGVVVTGSVEFLDIAFVTATSVFFLVATIYLGPRFVRFAAGIMGKLHVVEAKMFTSYLFVMVLAWLANLVGLATIIGAFAAGLVLSDTHFEDSATRNHKSTTVRELMMPLEVILAPIFFILIGIQVKLETFASGEVLTIAAGLLVAAIFGKLLAGLGARKGINKLFVGIGMLPRGEVGLVFAAIGRGLGVFDDALFSAIILMVVVTTLITPPLLKMAADRQPP